MKSKLLLFSIAWLAIISIAHVAVNIGFSKLATKVRVAMGQEREELVVGFLPVT